MVYARRWTASTQPVSGASVERDPAFAGRITVDAQTGAEHVPCLQRTIEVLNVTAAPMTGPQGMLCTDDGVDLDTLRTRLNDPRYARMCVCFLRSLSLMI